MNLTVATAAFVVGCLLGSAQTLAQNAYITNGGDNTVSVISTATNTVIGSPISVGRQPAGVAVTPDGSKVYVTNYGDPGTPMDAGSVSVINTATNTVIGSPISVGRNPVGVAVTPDGSKVYVTNYGGTRTDLSDTGTTVSVISTATNTVIGSPISVGRNPVGVAVTPDGSKVYVTNEFAAGLGTVSVISTATNTVIGSPISVGRTPFGVAVTPDSRKVYVTNLQDNTVSVIDTATDAVIGSPISVGNCDCAPIARHSSQFPVTRRS
jgi:YVTN family beta-propeller protein